MAEQERVVSDARKRRKTATKSDKIRSGMREVERVRPRNPHDSNLSSMKDQFKSILK